MLFLESITIQILNIMIIGCDQPLFEPQQIFKTYKTREWKFNLDMSDLPDLTEVLIVKSSKRCNWEFKSEKRSV